MAYAKLEPSGCGIHKYRIKLRLDFFLKSGDSPFHSHFIYPDKDASDADIKAEIEKCLNYFYAFHQHCWNTGQQFCGKDEDGKVVGLWERVPAKKGSIRERLIPGNAKDIHKHEAKVQDIVSRCDEFQVSPSKIPPQDLNIGEKGTIDVGSPAIDRDWYKALSISIKAYTVINYNNPANATGIIDTVAAHFSIADSGNIFRVGSFIAEGGGWFTCHDGEELGTVPVGYKQFTGVSVDIDTGEYIGCDGKQGSVNLQIDVSISGGGGMYDQDGALCDPEDYDWYTIAVAYIVSLYGTGTEGGINKLIVEDTNILLKSDANTLLIY